MKEPGKQLPYQTLGELLKKLREKSQESLAEVSSAVEIDVTLLTDIERGTARPSEDILMLLISHFAIPEEEAVSIWEMAGYVEDHIPDKQLPGTSDHVRQVMVLPMDARIAYTDMAHIAVSKQGVVMNFMQEMGLSGQPLAVARIGMSHQHAKEVLKLLTRALAEQQPKLLPDPEAKDKDNKSK